MKAVIADKLAPEAVEALRAMCTSVVFEPTLKGEALAEACADANIVVVRSTEVRESTMERCSGLKLVIRAGSGYNTIDTKQGAERGVAVANCPGKNAVAVAELALGLMLSLDRLIPDNVISFRDGSWNKAGFAKAQGLKGRTLGLVGVGNIGSLVAERAKAFGMPVIAFDPYVAPEKLREIGIEPCASLDELLPRADVVSLHAAQTAETTGLIGREQLKALRPGSFLINTSRAGLVDEAALIEAVKENGILAAVDVFEGEPSDKTGPVSSPLQAQKGVYVTHHIGASTQQAQSAVADEVVKIVKTFLDSGKVLNCVNL
jgi:D-3-phosphoglycerate dehydrogenase / 2-oxoglutarate reductase